MILKLRIYRRHDLDLMGLVANTSFDFAGAVKSALRSYAKGKPQKIPLPKENTFNKAVNYSVAQIHIKLDDKTDADIIKFITGLPDGSRNCFVKTLLRNLLETPYTPAFTGEIQFRKPKAKNIEGSPEDNIDKIFKDVIKKQSKGE